MLIALLTWIALSVLPIAAQFIAQSPVFERAMPSETSPMKRTASAFNHTVSFREMALPSPPPWVI